MFRRAKQPWRSTCNAEAMLQNGHPLPASTGVAELDGVLGGLFWGDNVLWEAPELADVRPFIDAFAAGRAAYGSAYAVSVERTPEEAAAALPGFGVLDARPGQELAHLPALLAAVRRTADSGRPTALV